MDTADPHHKFCQHDAVDPGADPEVVDDRDAVWADAVTPEEYVLSSDEAMASAVAQQAEFDAGQP